MVNLQRSCKWKQHPWFAFLYCWSVSLYKPALKGKCWETTAGVKVWYNSSSLSSWPKFYLCACSWLKITCNILCNCRWCLLCDTTAALYLTLFLIPVIYTNSAVNIRMTWVSNISGLKTTPLFALVWIVCILVIVFLLGLSSSSTFSCFNGKQEQALEVDGNPSGKSFSLLNFHEMKASCIFFTFTRVM